VAVVGAGPAGLTCAAELAGRGHDVTVFDAHDAPGGILRYGIPSYRLPDRVVDGEIERLRGLGVRFELGARVGVSETIEQLGARHDAVFLAIGVGESVLPGVPGEDLPGVMTANDYLERVNVDMATAPRARRVAVLGGGNVAMDAARCALRLGAETVTIAYRRDRGQLPACAAELHEAEAEGVRFVFLASPLEILGSDGRTCAVRCERMVLGEPDASGRARPVSTGEELVIEADLVILALGSRVEPWLTVANPGIRTSPAGLPEVAADGSTSLSGVYAGGDLVRGPATVVEAIGDGRRAAEAIDRALRSARA
jgi:glutamate synthase (NADPH/NADH) small chain